MTHVCQIAPWPTVAFLIAAWMVVWPCSYAGDVYPVPDSPGQPELIAGFLQGKAAAREELVACGPDGITAIEGFLALRAHVDRETIPMLVTQLGHQEYRIRQTSTDTLSTFPASALPVILDLVKDSRDPEVRMRIKRLIENINASEARLPALLQLLDEMYNTHAERVVAQKLPVLMKSPGDMRVAYSLNRVEFEKAWGLLTSAANEAKLTYLLLKVYAADSQQALAKLKAFAAADVLSVAAATWWPTEIEPLQKDGTYGWTTRAESVEGNMAWNVIRLSVKMPDYGNVAERGEWEHLNQWSEITYIFRFPAYYSKSVVGYGRRIAMPAKIVRWMNPPASRPAQAEGHCDTFRGIPTTARLPLAHISDKESLDWHLGKVYEWAKPLFPEDLAKELSFVESKYGKPEIVKPNQPLKGTTGSDLRRVIGNPPVVVRSSRESCPVPGPLPSVRPVA